MYFITVSCAVKTQLKGKNSNLTYKFQILVTGGINDNKFIKMYQMLIFLITDTITTAIYKITRGSQEPVIAHLVFNLTSKVDRKWGCYT